VPDPPNCAAIDADMPKPPGSTLARLTHRADVLAAPQVRRRCREGRSSLQGGARTAAPLGDSEDDSRYEEVWKRPIGRVYSAHNVNAMSLESGLRTSAIAIPPKESGFGSSVFGGELLKYGFVTYCCNDNSREAARMGMAGKDVGMGVQN